MGCATTSLEIGTNRMVCSTPTIFEVDSRRTASATSDVGIMPITPTSGLDDASVAGVPGIGSRGASVRASLTRSNVTNGLATKDSVVAIIDFYLICVSISDSKRAMTSSLVDDRIAVIAGTPEMA